MSHNYRIVYHNKDSDKYLRVFANLSFVQHTPQSEIVIDFYEEYIEPFMVTEKIYYEETEQTEYNRPSDRVDIHRERKCTVTMSKEQAVNMAKWILANYGE
ncbi:hypothetical protein [Effusibacillus lacus]|uniref:Uncharacterized protein n=1 Tax=Effusibacillus lacus TaxID=1348429 RepID=A0A292YPN0_9BACL|nr:hypothetical protein [Effusibacillus lacus]TCS76538.1 hypothetical protein EDD64_10283 [Effusibacillus lacus]GAX90440.1 hypothetical protein EFBL_2067 [Effusibacillus lacus]